MYRLGIPMFAAFVVHGCRGRAAEKKRSRDEQGGLLSRTSRLEKRCNEIEKALRAVACAGE